MLNPVCTRDRLRGELEPPHDSIPLICMCSKCLDLTAFYQVHVVMNIFHPKSHPQFLHRTCRYKMDPLAPSGVTGLGTPRAKPGKIGENLKFLCQGSVG